MNLSDKELIDANYILLRLVADTAEFGRGLVRDDSKQLDTNIRQMRESVTELVKIMRKSRRRKQPV